MKGAYKIEVVHKRLRYELTIKRNITFIRGFSGTGKTTLVRLLDNYLNKGIDSGVKVRCEKSIMTLDAKKWETMLADTHDSIVFIDDGDKFIQSKAFADAIASTDNYYVLITREEIPTLPYSIHEIYEFKSNGKAEKGEPVYNSMQQLYSSDQIITCIKPTTIVTEDSKAGYKLFKQISDERGIECLYVSGKSNINKFIKNNTGGKILLIADGAAFGCEMNKVIEAIQEHPNCMIYLPESFEWLILKSGVLRSKRVEEILKHPEDYIESSKYLSWERYFTYLLGVETEKIMGISKYNKTGDLDKYFTTPQSIEKILGIMKGIDLGQREGG